MLLHWLGFLLCTAAIVFFGIRLSRYGDILAEKSGLGRTAVGMIFVALVTSLPELVTGIGAVTYAQAPDIAVGDVLGSCVFNLVILAVLDALVRPEPLSARAGFGHILTAAFGIALLGSTALSLLFARQIGALGWIGPYSLVFLLGYVAALHLIHRYERRRRAEFLRERAEEPRYAAIPLRTAVVRYVGNAAGVVAAAGLLPHLSKGIARGTGLGETFVGNAFVAVSTSLPEVVVSLAALRMGAVDLAIGNLFGSNIFNISILAVDDLFYTAGPLLSAVSPFHLVSALSAIVMSATAIVGLTYRAERKILFMAWDSVAILGIYLGNLLLLYATR